MVHCMNDKTHNAGRLTCTSGFRASYRNSHNIASNDRVKFALQFFQTDLCAVRSTEVSSLEKIEIFSL